MTVTTNDNREQYVGNDLATSFDYAFKIFKADDLVVILTDSDGVETTLVRGTHYSVDGVGDENGGSVTYPISGDPLANGETLTILREIPVVQETDLRNQGAYYPETVEDELDRSRMIDQQLDETQSRTLKKTKGAGGQYDAAGARIQNLGNAVADSDALTNKQMQDYYATIRESVERANHFIEGAEYIYLGDYAAGITIEHYNQLLRGPSGEFWRVSGSTALPYTTTGAGLPEGGAFVTVGDAALRAQLADNTAALGSDLIAHTGTTDTVTEALDKRTIYVGSVAESFSSRAIVDGQQISVRTWHSGAAVNINPVGGGLFVALAGVAKSNHNGGTFISPTVPPVSAQAGATQKDKEANFRAGAGETDPSGAGGFARIMDGQPINPQWFGALGDGDGADGGGADDTDAIQSALQYLSTAFFGFNRAGNEYFDSSTVDLPAAGIHFPRGRYILTKELEVPRGIRITGDGARNHGAVKLEQITPGQACLDLWGLPTLHAGEAQRIADQQISGLFFSVKEGSAIKALKDHAPISGFTDFYSIGSLSIDSCFFLDMSGSTGTNYAAVDVFGAERITNCTFDAMETCGIRSGKVSSIVGNTFFRNARGGIVFDAQRRGVADDLSSMVTGNIFASCGSTVTGTGAFSAGVVFTGTTGFVENVSVVGNEFWSEAGIGDFGVRSDPAITLKRIKIQANKFFRHNGDAVLLHNLTDSTISNNEADACGNTATGSAIIAVRGNSSQVKVKDNVVSGTTRAGVEDIAVDPMAVEVEVSGNTTDRDIINFNAASGRKFGNFKIGEIPAINSPSATDWQSPFTYANAWVDGANPLQVRINEIGEVVWRGTMTGGSVGALAFNGLPSKFTPGASKDFIAKGGAASSSYAQVSLNAAGEGYVFYVNDATNTNIRFDQIRY